MSKQPYQLTTINGIKTVLYPVRDLPAIKIDLISRAGGWYEIGETWGEYHYLEHLVHNGTEKFPRVLDIEYFKEDNGLTSNAYTGGGQLGFWVKGPYYNLRQALILINQIVFCPRLDEGFFAKELDVINQEYQDKWDNPHMRFGQELKRQFFGDNHPYTHDGLGQPEHINQVSKTRLEELHQHAFQAENITMAITGNFDIDQVKAEAESIITPIKDKHLTLPSIHKQPIVDKPEVLVHTETVSQEQVVIRWPLPGDDLTTNKDRIIFNIARYILGGSARSQIFQELRERRGLIYRGGSNLSLYPDVGYFEVWVSTTPKNRDTCIELLQQIVYQFITSPIDEAIFNRAIKYMDASTIVNFDSIDAIASHILADLFWNQEITLPDELIKISASITPQDVTNSLIEYLKPEKEFLSILAAKKESPLISETSHVSVLAAD